MEPTTWTLMNHHTWIDVVMITVITIPSVIAAVSSLKNGRTLNGKVNPKVEDVHAAIVRPPARKTSSGESKDWYKTPDLD